ncbi:2-dehydro-3-deoxygalactonokinase [Marimonas lutisalis]|uniref:2-dehydro-3-deoxygalactonokinase n=1 Tax=Marimonas lutisalis TaxID=2545756 RepID=UPI00137557C4|nr:2-dehydro-3-deoxygalactonokinase [Marimonas lutisalis]
MSDTVPCPALGDADVVQGSPRARMEAIARLAVAGLAQARPNWDGVVLLPGDPTHWVYLSAGEIIGFVSFLTERLARALNAEDGAESRAIEETMARPERLAQHLAMADLGGNSDEILGHLIGAELAAARSYWLGREVVVLGDGALARAYEEALAAQHVPVARGDVRACLEAAREALT